MIIRACTKNAAEAMEINIPGYTFGLNELFQNRPDAWRSEGMQVCADSVGAFSGESIQAHIQHAQKQRQGTSCEGNDGKKL
jgi:hypothetical protein